MTSKKMMFGEYSFFIYDRSVPFYGVKKKNLRKRSYFFVWKNFVFSSTDSENRNLDWNYNPTDFEILWVLLCGLEDQRALKKEGVCWKKDGRAKIIETEKL